jgi:ankyrin repeat protein
VTDDAPVPPAPEPLTDEELAFLASMFDLARSGATGDLERAVRAGVPVNLTNSGGDTLLVLAAYHGHPATVRTLLDLGADTERVNDRGQTALGSAVFRQSAEIVSMLLAAGADPYGGGRSAIDVATFFELPAMLALLQDAADAPAEPTAD